MNFGYLKGPLCTLERIFLILVPGESRFRTVILLVIVHNLWNLSYDSVYFILE